ncbi:monovalent cation/H+ antiporter complex subunit F [Desulfovibrio ferrophilus]|uniref:Multiple resistance and pH regulation protein F n=1 Tax=Desulfovibrio ferrophilus TaxID=241368 RepID=A0A2Z6AXZ3_9BACT|nr:monovalent cation/H+ antiporter complex subunit F [Desulfovibrio ferrophilus]BBD08016.1 multiple resistance and pH regulation protein F [Desulfovibrio ferrophilus]
MDGFFLTTALILIGLMLMTLYRAIVGPTVLDRLLGVNGIGSKTVVLLVIAGHLFHREEMFVDIALAYGMLNFIAVIASAKFFQKRKGLHQEPQGQ